MSILDQIVADKRASLERSQSNGRDFREVFTTSGVQCIWEVKIASPSFDYLDRVDPLAYIEYLWNYEAISAMSILIDEKYFKGDITRIQHAKQYQKPIFFKEFVVSERQIDGAWYHGYDALLLIKRSLSDEEITKLATYTVSKWMYPIIEVDTAQDLEVLFALVWSNQRWIAINCRNLWTMEIDRSRHFSLYEEYSEQFARHQMFAFSWIDSVDQRHEYEWKYDGVLIGTSLVKEFLTHSK